MVTTTIDDRSWTDTLRFITAYDLASHSHELASLLLLIDGARHSNGTRFAIRRVMEIVAAYRAFHQEYPFRVVRAELLQRGNIHTGLRQKADGTELTLSDEDFSLSGLLPGPTGVGKSTVARHLATGALTAGHHVIIIDRKPDAGFRALAASHRDVFIIDPEMPLNLLRRDASLTETEHVSQLVEAGADTLYGAEDYRQIMNTAYHRAFARDEHATMIDVIEEIRRLPNKGETYKFRDAQRGAELRHTRFIERYPGLCTRGGAAPSVLFEHSLYLPLPMTNTELFLTTYLLRRLFTWNAWRQRCTP